MNSILRNISLIALFLIPILCSAQTGNKGGAAPAKADTAKVKTTPEDENAIHEFTDVEPSFPDYGKFMAENLQYPTKAIEDDLHGIVVTSFVVEKDGSLSNITVTKSLSLECDEAVIQLLIAMPAWNPGMNGGKPVRTKYSVTVKFSLDKGSSPARKEKKRRTRD